MAKWDYKGLSATIHVITLNTETHQIVLIWPQLQTIVTLTFQLVDWSIYREVCIVQCSRKLGGGDVSKASIKNLCLPQSLFSPLTQNPIENSHKLLMEGTK